MTKVYQIQVYKQGKAGFLEYENSQLNVYLSDKNLNQLLSQYHCFITERLEAMGILIVERKQNCYKQYYKIFSLTPKALNSVRIKASVAYKRIKNGLEAYYRSKFNKLRGVDMQVFNMLCKLKIVISEAELKDEILLRYPKYKAEKNEYIANISTRNEKAKGINIMNESEYLYQYKFYKEYIEIWNKSTKVEKRAFVSVDTFGNRFHSIFTSLPSFIRKYVKHKGIDNLVCLDLHQSQPTILAKLLYDAAGMNSFANAVNSGDIYDTYPYIRKNAKKQFLRSIFSRCSSKAYKELNVMHPKLGAYIRDIQEEKLYRDNVIVEKHKNTACLLQRAESRIFRNIWKRLLFEGVVFLNVHDAIYVDESKKQQAINIMNSILKKELYPINYNIQYEA